MELKTLLAQAIQAGCSGDTQNIEQETCKTQINLGGLYTLLEQIIDGQTVIKLAMTDHDSRLDSLETEINRIGNLNKKHSRKPSEDITTHQPLPPLSRPSSAASNKSRQPSRPPSATKTVSEVSIPAQRRSTLGSLPQAKSSSSMQLAQMSVLNFADRNDLEKLNTRINLLQTKLDKLTDIVPTNDQILANMQGLLQENQKEETIPIELKESASDTAVKDAWSKHVLTKRIESNEESLEKFMQLIDELSNRIKGMKQELSAQLAKALSENTSTAQVEAALASIQDVLKRLETLESGMSKLEGVNKRLTELAKSHKDFKGSSDERHGTLASEVAALAGMIGKLESELKLLSQQMSAVNAGLQHAQQQAAAALAAAQCKGSDGAPPPPVMAPPPMPVPDLETIRELGELRQRVGSLDEKVLGLENVKVNKDELDLMKASILEEIPSYLNNALGTIRDQLQALAEQNDKLNEIIDIKLKREEAPSAPATPASSRPRTPKADMDKFATKQHVEQVQSALQNSTAQLDGRISGDIVDLHDKLKAGTESLWDEIARLKAQYGNFEEDLGNLRQHVIAKLSNLKGGAATPPGETAGLSNVSTLSPALTNLIDRLQKKQFELEQNLQDVQGGLAKLDEDGRLRSDDIAGLRARIDELDAKKADKSEITRLDEKKADLAELNVKVSRDDFDSAIEDMSKQLGGLLGKMLEVEQNWQTSLEQTNAKLQNTVNSDEMKNFRKGLEERLKALKSLLEQTQTSTFEHGDHTDEAAIYRKPLLGYKCVSCDKVTLPVPGQPVASIPVSGNLPHMHTIRPYTTFDLHTIRAQSKITKTGYEERIWLKMKNNLDKSYREHVAEGLNQAFNAFEQDASDTIPIGGGSSIPKGYHISRAGRSCGGGHTLTNPHVRFTHLKQLGEMWNEAENQQTQAQPQQELANQYEESRQEMQLLGNNGHVYRGRTQKDASGKT